jgi:hypothetical protein
MAAQYDNVQGSNVTSRFDTADVRSSYLLHRFLPALACTVVRINPGFEIHDREILEINSPYAAVYQ